MSEVRPGMTSAVQDCVNCIEERAKAGMAKMDGVREKLDQGKIDRETAAKLLRENEKRNQKVISTNDFDGRSLTTKSPESIVIGRRTGSF